MFDRNMGYRGYRELLATMAYFCLTVLETSTGQREAPARQPRSITTSTKRSSTGSAFSPRRKAVLAPERPRAPTVTCRTTKPVSWTRPSRPSFAELPRSLTIPPPPVGPSHCRTCPRCVVPPPTPRTSSPSQVLGWGQILLGFAVSHNHSPPNPRIVASRIDGNGLDTLHPCSMDVLRKLENIRQTASRPERGRQLRPSRIVSDRSFEQLRESRSRRTRRAHRRLTASPSRTEKAVKGQGVIPMSFVGLVRLAVPHFEGRSDSNAPALRHRLRNQAKRPACFTRHAPQIAQVVVERIYRRQTKPPAVVDEPVELRDRRLLTLGRSPVVQLRVLPILIVQALRLRCWISWFSPGGTRKQHSS